MRQFCIIPKVSGVGGMVSFRGRLTAGLEARGYKVVHDLHNLGCKSQTILVIGGTREISGLLRAKRQGHRIVQRLNGMNWLHRKLKTGIRHYIKAEYGNLVLSIIRSRIADHIVYQSEFARDWWERLKGHPLVDSSVIYNGVNLLEFSPDKKSELVGVNVQKDSFRVLIVEGSLQGGYEVGLESAIGLVNNLNSSHRHELDKPVELFVVGDVSDSVKRVWSQRAKFKITWAGLVPQNQIPAIDASSHLLYSSDINAACPNSVIEALACGTPILAFDTGAIPELVGKDSGKVIPYGGNPWNLDKPDIKSLAQGGVEILLEPHRFHSGARQRAEAKFGLDMMVESYLDDLFA